MRIFVYIFGLSTSTVSSICKMISSVDAAAAIVAALTFYRKRKKIHSRII